MRLFLALVVVVAVGATLVVSPESLSVNWAMAQQSNVPPPNPNCQPFGDAVPMGVEQPVPSYEPTLPIWCYQLSPGSGTYVEGANDWIDTYDNNGPALQHVDEDYNVFAESSQG